MRKMYVSKSTYEHNHIAYKVVTVIFYNELSLEMDRTKR